MRATWPRRLATRRLTEPYAPELLRVGRPRTQREVVLASAQLRPNHRCQVCRWDPGWKSRIPNTRIVCHKLRGHTNEVLTVPLALCRDVKCLPHKRRGPSSKGKK